jgi:iron complex outermembrane receptor protein
VDISKLPVNNASEIIINRGTSSALYGTTGTVGSINIVTTKPVGLYARGGIEYGLNNDWTLTAAHGNTIGNFYYWIDATVSKENPYDVSSRLTKTERSRWFDKFYPTDLGYTVTSNSETTKYLNDTGEWPWQEQFKYTTAGKIGYEFSENLETGVSANFTQNWTKRYRLGLSNTENTTWNQSGYANQWSWKSTSLAMDAYCADWEAYSISVAPYVNYKKGDFAGKANVFYILNNEVLDAFGDEDRDTVVAKSWAGVHSNWINTSSGFNVLPSYKLTSWNRLNSSMLFRWDRHEEREQVDTDFLGSSLASSQGSAWAAYNLAGDNSYRTKLMEGEQFTLALEDELDMNSFGIPVNVSLGASYDAMNLDKYQVRSATRVSSQVTSYGEMVHKTIADDDSTIWGTRDSFNPVLGVTCEPLKDFIVLRGSFSKKTKLPTMAMYASISDYNTTNQDLKSERSYNGNAGIEFLFLKRAVSLRTDYFYSRYKDKIATGYDTDHASKYYVNIDGEIHQGVEAILGFKLADVSNLMDMNLNLSYTYTDVENLDSDSLDTSIYKGKRVADVPMHQYVADLRFNFITQTVLNIFGEYTANTIQYVMKSNPSGAVTDSDQTTAAYKSVRLHDSLMFNIKLSQKFLEHYEGYILCKNIFDDYAADPFNPGPGRQFYAGLKAEL